MLDKKSFINKIITTLAVLVILIIGAFILFSILKSDDETNGTGDVDYVDVDVGSSDVADAGSDVADAGSDYVDTGGGDGTGGSLDTLVDPSYKPLWASGSKLNEIVEEMVKCPSGWLLMIQGVVGGYNSKVNDSYASIAISKFLYHHYGIQRLETMLYRLTDILYDATLDTFTLDCTYKCVEPNTVLDFDPWCVEIKSLYGWLPVDDQCSFPLLTPISILAIEMVTITPLRKLLMYALRIVAVKAI